MNKLPQSIYVYLYFLWAVAILLGLFLPLMEKDSAQHATMALTIAQTDDFSSLLRGGRDYLDKPHLHFWLSALSIKVFGIYEWAYRLPAILFTILAAFSLRQIGFILFNKAIGRLSSLLFLTSQAIILSLHDVRTDAILTAMFIFAIHQWVRVFIQNKTSASVWAGLFTAMAFGTKGLVAIGVIGLLFLLYFIQSKKWHKLLQFRFFLAVLSFLLASLPFFYAYYLQFGIDGVKFLAYDQILGRYGGSQFGGASSNDYFFFFHTILWAFLPWSIPLVVALVVSLKNRRSPEWFIALTAILFMLIMNFSSFKLPHYLNIVFPLFALITANFLYKTYNSPKVGLKNFITVSQYVLILLSGILLCFLSLYCFPMKGFDKILILLFSIISLFIVYLGIREDFQRMIVLSCGGFLIINIYLNAGFYPSILEYQAGTYFGQVIQHQKIAKDEVYMSSDQYSWALDWKTHRTTPKKDFEYFKQLKSNVWLMTYDITPEDLKAKGLQVGTVYNHSQYPVTRLTPDFINPRTRKSVIKKAYLIEILPN